MYREENTKKRLIVSPDVPRTFRRSSISLPRPIPQEHYASKMHSLDPRNGRAQPFESVALPHLQQLAGRGRLRKSFQVRACVLYRGLHYGLRYAQQTSGANAEVEPHIAGRVESFDS